MQFRKEGAVKSYKKLILLSLLLIFSSSLVVLLKNNHYENKKEEYTSVIESIEIQDNTRQDEKEKTEEVNTKKFENDVIGILIIPSIEVKAAIKEGTSQEVLKYSVRTF